MSFPTLPALSSLTGVGCPLCIRTGNFFCSNGAPFFHGDYAATVTVSMCCTAVTSTDCPDAYDSSSVRLTSVYCIDTSSYKETAVLACPQDKTKCGNVASNVITFASAD